MGPAIDPGVYFDLTAAEYHAAPGLSNSGMKKLAISPLHFWHEEINPNRPEKTETPAMKVGSALHAAVLEPDTFLDRYACAVTQEDFPGCLDTISDIKAWLVEKGGPTKGNKPELIEAALKIDKDVKILDIEMKRNAGKNAGKIMLNKVDWERVYGMATALLREAALKPILDNGRKEVSIFAIDPETGVLLKSRLDWMWPTGTLDLKSFSERGSSIDDTVTKAIRYEAYYRQGWLYTYMRKLVEHGDTMWVNAFVESEQPHEVRLRHMGPDGDAAPNKYWDMAENETRSLIERYARYSKEFGVRPWAYHQEIVPVRDRDLRGIGRNLEEE